ncbi:MAG: FAD binding domain-containing protein [Deltaproteobacteria bacterium]|nr:FAD binding domain-containing protein [Deltaproteobacteria bacterium]
MRLPKFEYVKPASTEEALAVLEKSGKNARILAGGTDLLVNMKYRVTRPEIVIGIKSLKDLSLISSNGNGPTKIGAAVTLSELAGNSRIAEEFPVFIHAVKSVASQHIRNAATIGGNICLDTRCWYYNQTKLWRDSRELCHKTGGNVCHAIKGSDRCHAINNSDTAPALIALDAKISVMKKGSERVVPVKDFFREDGSRHTVLEPGEIITALSLPENDSSSHATFIKVSIRKGLDFANGSIAALVSGEGKGVTAVRLILGSMTSAPLSLKKASQVILESGLTEESIEKAAVVARSELGTLTNLFTSSGYKRHLAETLVKRALQELKAKTKKPRRAKS